MRSIVTDKCASLAPTLKHLLGGAGTEPPFTGKYYKTASPGTYLCRQCGTSLFRSGAKFNSGTGWPSFDASIENSILERTDEDGLRTEIVCAQCKAHLGHVFRGEHFTPKQVRYCVNSGCLDFAECTEVMHTGEAILAGGCFWGVEALFRAMEGVVNVEVGYIGGMTAQPTYDAVCQGLTGHFEAARILYDRSKTDYESIIKYFFEIHNPWQTTGQGPDIGTQYQSAIFYYDSVQKNTALQVIELLSELTKKKVATKMCPMNIFWPAEAVHQNYYENNGKQPYCHIYQKRF